MSSKACPSRLCQAPTAGAKAVLGRSTSRSHKRQSISFPRSSSRRALAPAVVRLRTRSTKHPLPPRMASRRAPARRVPSSTAILVRPCRPVHRARRAAPSSSAPPTPRLRPHQRQRQHLRLLRQGMRDRAAAAGWRPARAIQAQAAGGLAALLQRTAAARLQARHLRLLRRPHAMACPVAAPGRCARHSTPLLPSLPLPRPRHPQAARRATSSLARRPHPRLHLRPRRRRRAQAVARASCRWSRCRRSAPCPRLAQTAPRWRAPWATRSGRGSSSLRLRRRRRPRRRANGLRRRARQARRAAARPAPPTASCCLPRRRRGAAQPVQARLDMRKAPRRTPVAPPSYLLPSRRANASCSRKPRRSG